MNTLTTPIDNPAKNSEKNLGTRFLVYPQPPFVRGYEHPEVVWLAPSPGEIAAGPADHRMYVAEPVEPKSPYKFPEMPPYAGRIRPPVEPGPDRHFDYLTPGTFNFLSAHVYACVRRVLDICEGYIGREIPWHFAPMVERLEIVPIIPGWDNAQSGFGFLELGENDDADHQFCYGLNFDAVAHEVGHLVLLSELGLPQFTEGGPDFFCYHEAIADFISLLGLLHFDTALDRVLRRTGGNLLIHNELDRFAETGDESQLRNFSNSLRLNDVSFEVHDRSKPFAGALFDCLLEVHQSLLFDRGISRLDPRKYSDLRRQMPVSQIEERLSATKSDYRFRHFATKAALTDARDIIGEAMIRSWRTLDPDHINFEDAAAAFLHEAELGRGRSNVNQFEDCFRWREIL
ncbi:MULTISPECIES: hypothetical protein [unclassified Mesorhizobium]|uniref:hypothetical protein n=1 Tax=unclassified Mesorhizobium TaxID=325217 RepID=UPI0030152369